MIQIPMRPKDRASCSGLKDAEQEALSYYILSGCTKEHAYEIFVLSEFRVSPAALKKRASMFFSGEPARRYMFAYKETLQAFFDGMKPKAAQVNAKDAESDGKHVAGVTTFSAEVTKERKAAAVQKIIDYVISEAGNIGSSEDPEMLVKIADKVGLFDDVEKAVEAPRRYLPETCRSCRFFQFCTSDDNVVDECPRCRYREYANANGVYYSHKDMLMPVEAQSVAAQAEAHGEVSKRDATPREAQADAAQASEY